MKPIEQLEGFPMLETIVDILTARVQNPDRNFFTILTCYHLTKLASMMRVEVDSKGLGKSQVSFYGIDCAPSGYGKGFSTKIIEEEIVHLFRNHFMEITRPTIVEKNLYELAIKRAQRKGTDEQEEYEKTTKEFAKLGAYITSFDSGTTPAVKQFRHQLLMSEIGSINFEVDEMGNNLLGNKEVIDVYLELFEGIVKPKLVKNTADSVRNEEILAKTPTNMIMFGTATALLDGAQVEKQFMDMLATGYSRRCFFGFSNTDLKHREKDIDTRLKRLLDLSSNTELSNIAVKLQRLADPINYKFKVNVPDDVLREVIKYQIYCEGIAEGFKSTDEIRKAEATGRYYKSLRLAGTFAFLDSNPEMTIEHWEAAVKVAEMSAKCLDEMLKTDPAHVRLAKYLAECSEPTTYADLVEELPFFPKSSTPQKDMIKLAIAYGHKNNIILKRSIVDDIEFIHGESLKETNLDEIILSWCSSAFEGVSEGFNSEYKAKFDKLDKVTQLTNGHWCNHTFVDGIRKQVNAIRGFNLLVLDIDSGTPLDAAKELLKDYTYHIYTTRHHQVSKDNKHACDRYRIVLPTNYILKLSKEEYKEFMQNVFEFLPFESDEQTNQVNRKWLSNPSGEVFTNEGKLFNVLPFIPKTKKNEERKKFLDDLGTMDKLERYFYQSAEEGNRNNTLFKYGVALVDAGYGLDAIILKIKDFNSKLPKPLLDEELQNTVMNSVTNKFYTK